MKIIQIISITAFITVGFTSKAQLSHPHFLSVNFGTNVPLSDYKDADSLTGTSANQGLYYSFEAGAYFSKIMGVGINIGAFSNSVNDASIEEQLRNDFVSSDGKVDVSSENWSNGYIMIGPYFSFGSTKFIVDAKILAGVVNSEKPFVNIEASDAAGTDISIAEVSSTSLGVNYGLHFRIQLKSKLALRVNAEGLLSQQEFVSKIKSVDGMGNEVNSRVITEQEISALNLGLGIVINL